MILALTTSLVKAWEGKSKGKREKGKGGKRRREGNGQEKLHPPTNNSWIRHCRKLLPRTTMAGEPLSAPTPASASALNFGPLELSVRNSTTADKCKNAGTIGRIFDRIELPLCPVGSVLGVFF
jgi:hypothetical protein